MLHFKISGAAYAFLCFAVIISTAAATDDSFVSPLCPNSSNPNASIYYPNSTYKANLDQLLSWLLTNSSTRENGFYNTTIGASSDPNNTIYGAFLCRGDITTNACHDCVSTAEKRVLHDCSVERSAMIWFPECYVRYSDQSFFSIPTENPLIYACNLSNVSDESRFMQLLGDTINTAAEQAAKGGADKKFGTKEANISVFQTLHTLAQCTPDLSQLDCQQCLQSAIGTIPSRCNGKQGITVRYPSCNIRYELYPFYNQLTVPVPTPQPQEPVPPRPNPREKSRISAGIIVAIMASVVFVSLVIFTAFWIICTRARRKKYTPMPDESVQISSEEYMQFDLDTVIAATNNFCDENKLGEGGFGVVYKGTLPNNQNIAVKRLSRSSQQGAEEFKNEVILVAKLQHRNLVRLLGFCLDGEEKMLIYEFASNKSLDHFLFDPNKQQQLNWPKRYNIIEGIARGMLYLHEDSQLRIIHRDLKASNVLLNEDLNPKISDFGLARIFGVDQTQGNTNRIVGTIGYISPEYAMHGHFSVKMDVYSFGVLLLEIISGRKITSFYDSDYGGNLLNYAWKHWRDGTPLELLDMTLRESYSRAEVIRCIHIGLSCVQEDPAERPTMQSIVLMLNSHSVTIANPKPPASYLQSRTQPSLPMEEWGNTDKSTSQSVSASVDEASITDLYPR